ncbi:hypothetical protein V865_004538 [Kwoniella europaea PYCC6329]|uniref:Protein CPL1-like domain-containing protein n=1 Tax=Kwoniella europaea PYCC6329 TaxID=1423913 RepID=A0AAX4KK52_9TREE
MYRNMLSIRDLGTPRFFWYTIDPTNEEVAIPNCRCSKSSPPIDTWRHGDATGVCIVEAVGDSYGSYLTRPTHEFTGCYDLTDPSSPAAFPVNSPEDCLSTCPTSTSDLRYTVIQVDQSKNWSCRCITDVSDILPFPETVLINCDIGAYFIHKYISTVTPSQAVRKRQHQRRILSGGKKEGDLCPVGLEACPVLRDSQEGDYECVDTTLELESCGGCVFGSDKSGVDCTTLPGISPAAVLCSQGECQALACAEGFTLVEGSCVSVLAE